VFPFLNKKLDFSPELEAHKVIHAGLDELLATIRASKADTTTFNADKLKEMMVKLKEPLVRACSKRLHPVSLTINFFFPYYCMQ
jgi:hypothetical protein